jgi:hypothetical protein
MPPLTKARVEGGTPPQKSFFPDSFDVEEFYAKISSRSKYLGSKIDRFADGKSLDHSCPPLPFFLRPENNC